MIVPHLASGYDRDHGVLTNGPLMSWKVPFSAGGVCATATDLLKWQTALDDGRVLSASSLKLMRSASELSDGTIIDYGLGTRLGSLNGHRMVGHTGSGGGFAAALVAFPDDRLTVVVLMNTEAGTAPALSMASDVARLSLGLRDKGKLLDLPVPSDELATIPGTFDSDEGLVETFARDGKLLFRLLPSRVEGPMFRQSAYVYAIDENTEVRSVPGRSGVKWAIVYTCGLMMGASRRIH
jgi:hypothetical protein